MGYPEWDGSRGERDTPPAPPGWDDRSGERTGGSSPRHSAASRPNPGDMYYSGSQDRYARPPDDEQDDEPEPKYIAAFIATAAWYLLPIATYAAWSLTLSGQPRAGCVDESGVPCAAPRSEALRHLMDIVPQGAVALALSISVAMLLGWMTSGWRPITVGFAAAVVGAGVGTVFFTVLKG